MKDSINTVLTAATVNHQFCDLLLSDPELALQQGYQGRSFNLDTSEQLVLVTACREATSLKELAQAIILEGKT